MEICPKCGLPSPACVCEEIAKTSQTITISTDKKRYGKIVTIVQGFNKDIEVKSVAKAMKNKLACGGTFDKEKGAIELQGDHRGKIKPILINLGFDAQTIEEQ
jgi:translation initiation factor 1